jgi:fucose 4-O-acetylase-like acetyltransferase
MADYSTSPEASAWSKAKEIAQSTPEARNRYVDFLRAVSITVVVLGHWLCTAPFMDQGTLRLGDLLHLAPWTQLLTWAFQVMPLFFIVGGYANGASWEAAKRVGHSYSLWIAVRLRRLVGPVVPLLVIWSLMAMLAQRLGVHPQLIRVGSQAAFIPTWFLAVYIMVVVTAPATLWTWTRFGMASFWGLALAALAVDTVAFAFNFPLLRWANYAFVWFAVHQIGYFWWGGRIARPVQALTLAAGGLTLLIVLVAYASYPVSMITVPGEEVSNSRPPTLALLALGMFHGGLVLAVEGPLRRWLRRPVPWTATVLVNGTIMTLYLWHMTVMVLTIGLAHVLGNIGLGFEPGTALWWAFRPVWLSVLAVFLMLFVSLFGHFEQMAKGGPSAPLSAWRALLGAALMCPGLAVLALKGIGSAGALGISIEIVIIVLLGAALVLGSTWRRTNTILLK